MTERASARHRADLRPSTPLTGITTTLTSTLSTVVSDHAGVVGRGGVVLAMSTGLVAAVGLPASAAPRTAGDPARTASVPMLPEVAASPVLSAGVDALAAAPVSAPAQAKVTFEHSAFKAVPGRHGATPAAAPTGAGRQVASISRSLTRAALAASQAATAQRRVAATPDRSASRADVTPAPTPAPAPSSASSVIAVAMRYLGVPYRYGGATPRGFDCSGFTQYVFAQMGVSLPRSADAQYRAVTRISRSQAVPGDLVFYLGAGGAYHVGIFLGGNRMVAAPHSGLAVRMQEIYSANVAFGHI